MRKATMLVLAMIIAATCLAGWERTYGGSGYDEGRSIVQVSDGGFAVAGTYSGVDTFGIWVLRINPTGDTLWTKIYGGSEFATGNSIIETSDSGFAVAGFSTSYTNYDAWVLRSNSAGDTIWIKIIDDSPDDRAYSIIQANDGGFVMVGKKDSSSLGRSNVWVLKLDLFGEISWNKTYGGIYEDIGYSIVQTTDGGFVVAGMYSYDSLYSDSDIWILRLDSYGDTLWTKRYGGAGSDNCYSIIQTSDGGFAATGQIYVDLSTDIWILKLNSFGDTVWIKTYGGPDGDFGYSIVQTLDGGYAITGHTRSFGADAVDIWLLRLDSFGDTLWTRTFGGSDWDRSYSIIQTSDNGFAIAGHTYSFGVGGDVYLIKTDSLGYTAIDETPSARPEEISIFAYPNPFNSAINIAIRGVGASDARPVQVGIEIFDISGRLVADLHGTNCGSPQFVPTPQIWQPEKSLGSGVYFVRARIGNKNIAKRVVYLK